MDLPPFLFLVFLLAVSTSPKLVKSSLRNNFTDLEALLALKANVVDPLGILSSNWTTSTSFCNWIGVTCSPRHHRVTMLNLYNITLQGTISPFIGNLSFLSLLALGNATLHGPIPDSLTHLPRLQTLVLDRNSLSGSIPPNLFNMSSLIGIYLTTNKLSGSLPKMNNQSLSSGAIPPPLQIIAIGDNQLTGELPSNFARFLNLEVLSLPDNKLSGSIPADFSYLQQLQLLYLTNNNLTGKIPHSLGKLTNLEKLEISINSLEGEIPEELGNLSNLQTFELGSNRLSGSIPVALLNASRIDFFELASNYLTGTVPPTLGQSMPLLNILNLENNKLTGGLEFITSLSNCNNLQRLDLETNELDGFLPDSSGNLSTSLEYFSVGINHVKGNIPATLGNLSGLLLLDLRGNEIVGAIPSSLSKIQRLQQLYFGNNQINGYIPIELGLMTSLSFLYLADNKLSGSIPDSLGNATSLQYVSLATNTLSSNVPQSLWSLRNVINLHLSGNALQGLVPPEVGDLEVLDTLDLSENKFSGNITSSIGELQMLTYLDLSRNSFTGEIPQSFGGLISVKYLNLSNNLLSGDIPKSLANLRYLEILDLSFNMLVGQIPQGPVFSNVTKPSLEGNTALCGAPQLKFSPCSARIDNSPSRRKIHMQYILPVISLLVVLSCLFVICIIHRRRKMTNLAATEFQSLGEHRVVSYNELARATNKFSEENLLGKGSFGSVYRGCLDDGLIVAVKILNMEVEGATKSFNAECETLSSVRHRNLIKIISTCSSLDFKALILQFMPNGSLDQWLYSQNYCLHLLQRLNIMVDVSLALEYLHHNHPQVILHCDLKPSNILLDEEMVAHVSDFGIAKLLLGHSRSIASASTPGTIGYIAPEYGSTGEVSKMGDVYSFGILLLETFTGKRPTDVIFDGESSMRECISRAYPNALFDIVDGNLLKGGSLPERNSEDRTAMYHCILSVIELGLLCTNYSPKERISMIDVVLRMQKIKMEYMSQLSTA